MGMCNTKNLETEEFLYVIVFFAVLIVYLRVIFSLNSV